VAILIQGYLGYEIEFTVHDTLVVVELVINGSVVSKVEEGLSSQTTQKVLLKLAHTVSSGFSDPWLDFRT
jgi:hypothetical protein